MFRPEERIYTRPFSEDSFYLFSCAEHFAHGEGFTCDGIHPTNGVQPLLVVIYSPLFLIAGADKLLAVRLAFILVAIFDSLSVIFIARLVRTLQKKPAVDEPFWKSPPIIAAGLWAGVYSILIHTANGLETGIYSTLLIGSLYYYGKLSRSRVEGNTVTSVQWIVLGIILGLTVLARIDAVFLVVIIAGYELYKFKAKGVASAAVVSITAFLISSPWWLYNYTSFGSIMPQSGVAETLEQGLLAENLRRGAIVIGDIFTVFFFLPNYDLPIWFHFAWLAAISAIVIWVVRKFDLRSYITRNYVTSSFTPYILFCSSLAIYYVFFFAAPHFLPRYFHPFRILWFVLVACAVPEMIRRLEEFYVKRKKLVTIGLCIFALCAAGFGGSRYVYYFVINKSSDFYRVGKYALEHPGERIGMQQSGTAGFIAPNVMNLDGKVNYAALQSLMQGDIGAYIESEKLDYIADWREFSESMVASAAKHGGKFIEIDSVGRVIVFRREK